MAGREGGAMGGSVEQAAGGAETASRGAEVAAEKQGEEGTREVVEAGSPKLGLEQGDAVGESAGLEAKRQKVGGEAS